jgi:hypothetical protein
VLISSLSISLSSSSSALVVVATATAIITVDNDKEQSPASVRQDVNTSIILNEKSLSIRDDAVSGGKPKINKNHHDDHESSSISSSHPFSKIKISRIEPSKIRNSNDLPNRELI